MQSCVGTWAKLGYTTFAATYTYFCVCVNSCTLYRGSGGMPCVFGPRDMSTHDSKKPLETLVGHLKKRCCHKKHCGRVGCVAV